MAGVTVIGGREAGRALGALAVGGEAARGAAYLVGSGLVYAYGIETSRHRGGRLARRAGGARMLTRAVQAVRAAGAAWVSDLVHTMVGRGAALDGRRVVQALAFRVLAYTMPGTPVRTGALRRSFHVSRLR